MKKQGSSAPKYQRLGTKVVYPVLLVLKENDNELPS